MRALLPALMLMAGAAQAEPVFPPASAIGLEPPEGFVVSRAFSGFENVPLRASLVLAEVPRVPFAQLAERFTPQALSAQGLAESSRESLQIAGGEALLVRGTQQVRGEATARWVLVFAAGEITGVVTANLPGDPPPATRMAVERALRSVAVRPRDPAAQRDALPFVFAETPGLRFRIALAGSAATLAPAEAPAGQPGAANFPSLTIAYAAGPAIPPERAMATAEQALAGLCHLRDLAIESRTRTTVAGAPAILLQARARDAVSGTPRLVTQWIAFFPEGGWLRAIAEAPADRYAASKVEFEQVVASLRRR